MDETPRAAARSFSSKRVRSLARNATIPLCYTYVCVDNRYRRPYQCRHTYASTLLTAGANPGFVAHQLGHEEISTLYKHYGKYVRENVPHMVDDIAAKARALQATRPAEAPSEQSDSHVIHTDDENA